jgi:magnesium transporter
MDFERTMQLLNEKKYNIIKSELGNYQTADIAEFIEELEEKQALVFFRLLPKEIASEVFSYLSVDRQAEISALANEKELANIVADLYFDDKVDYLEEMPAYVVKKILRNTSEAERKLINQFLAYPENSAGSLMTIEFVDIKKELTVSEVLDKIRKTGPNKETIYTCYVTDSWRHLLGTISLKELVLADVNTKIEDIMHTGPIYVNTHDDQEDIADTFKKYDLLAIPVVDNENRLVGIITIDDIVDVIEEENTEDFYKMAAVAPSDEEYINTGVLALSRKRIIWLLVLMISATFTGYIIKSFESTLSSVIALSAFIPMLMNTGGNAGSQASAIVIRSIVLGELSFKDIFKVFWKELRISLLVGSVLGFLNFIRIFFLERYSFPIALTVSATMLFTVVIAKVIGGMLPIIAKKLRLDPAIMSTPIISTIVDAVTLIIYFYFAMWFLKISV